VLCVSWPESQVEGWARAVATVDRVQWKAPELAATVGRQVFANPDQVRQLRSYATPERIAERRAHQEPAEDRTVGRVRNGLAHAAPGLERSGC
jgi:hypothetical protein